MGTTRLGGSRVSVLGFQNWDIQFCHLTYRNTKLHLSRIEIPTSDSRVLSWSLTSEPLTQERHIADKVGMV